MSAINTKKQIKCMFQRSYTVTMYRHSGSHSRHSIHLRSDDLNNYGWKQWQEYNIGGQQWKALLLLVQHPRQLIYIFSWQWLSERNQGLDFWHFWGWRCWWFCNTSPSSFWRVDRDPFQDRGILPSSSQRPPFGPGDKIGHPQLMNMPIFGLP